MAKFFHLLRYCLSGVITTGLLLTAQPAQAIVTSSRSPVAQAIHAELQTAILPETGFSQLLSNEKNRDETTYWTNALYASGGSASGNAALIALYIALEIGPPLLGLGNWTEGNEVLIASSLVIIPAITTPLFMHLWSPAAENDWPIWLWSGGSSLASSLLHAGLMLGTGLAFNELTGHTGSFSENFYLLAPVGIISAVLIESLATSQGHQYAARWQVTQAPGGGLMLAQTFKF